jgi:hypothetical protein
VKYNGNHAACRFRIEAGRKQSLKTAEAGLWRSAINYFTLIWYSQDGLHRSDVCVLGLLRTAENNSPRLLSDDNYARPQHISVGTNTITLHSISCTNMHYSAPHDVLGADP